MTQPLVQSTPATAPAALEKIAILDCGAQYTKVIDRRVRELNVCSDILPLNTPVEILKDYAAVILSGGPNSVFEPGAPQVDAALLNSGLPVLGICYGMQLIAHTMGGTVTPGTVKEFGETVINVSPDAPLFFEMASQQTVLMSHGDKVSALPPGFEQIAASGDIVAAMMHREKRIYGVQFHPEVELTEHGQTMLRHFLYRVVGLKGTYQLETRLDEVLDRIRTQVGTNPVFTLVSGGVDSAVTTALLLKALGPEQVYALHVDTGFMRHQESELVCQALSEMGLTHLEHLKASEDFLNATTELDGKVIGPLHTVTDPEEKRRIIGDTFFYLTQIAIDRMQLDPDKTYIAQGTLRPDLIESGNVDVSQIAHKIKTHHNDVPLIQAQREKGMIVEPNRDWHKDEVRRVGVMLGLPESVVQRQPFPGPGLAIRVLCADMPYITPEFETLNKDVHAVAESLGLDGHVLPVRSVGVQGDYRSYSYLATLSGEFSHSWEHLRDTAMQIPNRLHAINRVALVLAQSEPMPRDIRTITPTTLNAKTVGLLREIDHTVTETLKDAGLLPKISQLLSVLVPVGLTPQSYSIAIRAVVTGDYMTARPARLGDEIPWEVIQPLAKTLVARYPIDWVFYDVTSKPPATVEWE